ncbi:4-hydroxybenzoate synthetase (chorismate lyase) [Idiomarina sp. A28L]|uniref:chorismate--pyruvate lyase family protein n=1 Tax=Idiomarina sp. A28L TaxID=1036674 RepID=UPI00021389D2|nr:chorismate lyase [Idiomarina sp. A28L]EGN74512.1 4-hydroxybenzoate synthetase (chorismate lyase) [Idiomarina sp. A28L]
MERTPQHSILLGSDWQPVKTCQAPALVHAWLSDAGSLTEKLKALPGEFKVEVLGQYEAIAEANEYAVLGIKPQPVVIREVVLYSHNKPMVFARSILPFKELFDGSEFANLGANPLGERLFNRPDMQAGEIQASAFSASSAVGELNHRLNTTQMPLWGRRRCFHLPETPILVAEVFLSAAPCYS